MRIVPFVALLPRNNFAAAKTLLECTWMLFPIRSPITDNGREVTQPEGGMPGQRDSDRKHQGSRDEMRTWKTPPHISELNSAIAI